MVHSSLIPQRFRQLLAGFTLVSNWVVKTTVHSRSPLNFDLSCLAHKMFQLSSSSNMGVQYTIYESVLVYCSICISQIGPYITEYKEKAQSQRLSSNSHQAQITSVFFSRLSGQLKSKSSIVFWRLTRGISSTGCVSPSSAGSTSSTERLVPERGACDLGMRIGGSNGGSDSCPDRHSGDRAVGNLQAAEATSRSSTSETVVVSAASTASSGCLATASTSTCAKSGQDYTTIVKGTESCKGTSASSLLVITLCSVLHVSTGISAVSYISSDQPNLFYGVIISGDIEQDTLI